MGRPLSYVSRPFSCAKPAVIGRHLHMFFKLNRGFKWYSKGSSCCRWQGSALHTQSAGTVWYGRQAPWQHLAESSQDAAGLIAESQSGTVLFSWHALLFNIVSITLKRKNGKEKRRQSNIKNRVSVYDILRRICCIYDLNGIFIIKEYCLRKAIIGWL